ncbi:MAG: BF3164 family lipoprotein [Rhodothermales bacterium]
MDLALGESSIVVTDASSGSPLRLYDRASGVLTDSVDAVGEGPGELRRVWSLHQMHPNNFASVDVANRNTFHLHVTETKKMALSGFRPMPTEGMVTHVLQSDSTVSTVLGGSFGSQRFIEVAADGQVLRKFGDLPILLSNTGTDYDLRGEYRASPDGSKAVVVLTRADIIEIHDLRSGEPLAITWGPFEHDPLNGDRGYIDVSAGSDAIYALLSFQSDLHPSHLGNTILAFDWTGELKGRIILDGGFTALAVDESSSEFFLSRHDPTPAIVKVRIPEGLR